MVPPPSKRREGRISQIFFGLWVVSMAQNPDELRKLGQRLDEAQKRRAVKPSGPPPSQLGIAGRFSTELVAALVVGGGLGWGIDWLFGHFGHQTRPVFMILCVVLGAVAGIRNVMRAATEINARMTGGEEK
jgi:ATP synthase protein I